MRKRKASTQSRATIAGVRPTACSRCARTLDTWTFERDQGVAGCPCGEVIPYVFDDAPLEALSTTPRKPRLWVEDARTSGYTATLEPSLRWLWYTLPLIVLLSASGSRLSLSGATLGGTTGLVLAVGAMVAVIAWAWSQSARRWTFSIEGGRFRAQARGHVTEMALEEIQRFDVASRSEKQKVKAADERALFQLVVSRTNGERTRVPLFVESPSEAQFIAERANAMLASDGRTIDGDYRGQHVRVAETEIAPMRVDEGPLEELGEADADNAEPRRRHVGE